MLEGSRSRISFVIPVLNDADRLTRCLISIRGLRYPADRIEVIVADNGSTDASAAVARTSGATVMDLPGLRVADVRNRAARATRGDVIAFIDADHQIDEAWADSAVETLHGSNVAAVGAPYDPPADATWVQRQYDRFRSHHPDIRDVDWLASGNMAVWRREFERVGGFDTRLETCEDVDLCRRLRAGGARLLSDPRLKSTHFGDPATLGALLRGELWRGRDNLRVSLRPPLAIRDLASLALTVLELLCLVCIAAGVVIVPFSRALFGGAPLGAALVSVGLAGLVVLITVQSLRMLREHPVRPVDLVQVPAVAAVYGIARALALVCRAPHAVRQGARRRA